MRRKIIAGNWKMHGDRVLAAALAEACVSIVQARPHLDVIVFPPFTLLAGVAGRLSGSKAATGAQDVSEHARGAYTGEVSAAMLVEAGCTHVLVGHSERRQLHGEDDATVARKFMAAQAAGLVPVLCLGESRAERESGSTETVVGRQLGAVMEAAGVAALERAIVAYEPVWAIGTGLTASPDQAQSVHAFLRSEVARQDARIAASLRILYGGSVKPDNAAGLFGQEDIDGALIGGASLVAADFAAIADAARD
ncbi:triose-phosphate isomerase [Pseudofulvimonas gallinarii]|jgi:triosephosphate isomerase|uniref:Triosephosphate isomerase n=1 Tax=Pseudofulvimonas gallinarii TaxID=634155 RepID=A0A4S3KZS4_9GAMM|nr:triose-phosphate isomerase [Pseudofulvimonas gallinarii]TCT01163.1 triosephosphate isomerase [Pseudofulvimonas gallinarii]THD14933.1 triose-phosphate isomerase [Pseudofulvimonas gallinarii]